jgi:transposase
VAGQNTHRFGSKAEGTDQLLLRLEDDEVSAATAAPVAPPEQSDEGAKAKPKRKPLPEHLLRVEQMLSVGDAWLTDTLSRITGHKINRIDELLPWNYKG